MELFEFLNVMFTRPAEWNEMSNVEKKKQLFMVNRRLAIEFPREANALQHLRINPTHVVNYWQYFIRVKQKYTSIPGWMYTKGVKKTQEIKEQKVSVSQNVINEYARLNKIDHKSVEEALLFFPEEMKKELHEFEKLIKQ